MLRSQGLSALFNENLDSTAQAIFLSTSSGHLIGTSSTGSGTMSRLPPSLVRKAAILSTSTFGYHAEKLDQDQSSTSSTASEPDVHPVRINGKERETGHDSQIRGEQQVAYSNTSSMTASATQRSMSSAGGVFGAFGSGTAMHLCVQPLPLLAQAQWPSQRMSVSDSGNDQPESRLRRIVVEISIGQYTSGEHENGRSIVSAVSRDCAVESIGQGLCIGVIGPEQETVVSRGRSMEDHDLDDGLESDDTVSVQASISSASQPQDDTQHERERQIRLLGIRTEALAEFMRREFEGFQMPTTILL